MWLENINIDNDEEILEIIDIDIDKEILENNDINQMANRLEFGILNRATWGAGAQGYEGCGQGILMILYIIILADGLNKNGLAI